MATRVVCASILAALSLSSGQVLAGGPDRDWTARYAKTSQIIVRLETYEGSSNELGISANQFQRIREAARTPLNRLRAMSGGARVLRLSQKLDPARVAKIAERIAELPGVTYAVPDRLMHPLFFGNAVGTAEAPSDPRVFQQWHYYEPTGGISLAGAWNFTTGDPDIHVSIIDTGIRGAHKDLAGQWTGGYDFIDMLFNGRDGDGRDPDPTDPGDYFGGYASSWHGSHVAGTVGAATDNEVGVAGIAYGSTLQPVRALGPIGGFTSDIVDGIRWSAGLSVPDVPDNPNPARVINMSLGGSGSCDPVYQNAIDDSIDAGSVVVVAAGNSSDDASNYSPASCSGVITVASTDRTGDLADYSNYGSTVEISAPGGDTSTPTDGVLSTVDGGTTTPDSDSYAFYQGTSMAAPHVAGVVALMLSVYPELTPNQIDILLRFSARDFPEGSECATTADLCGAGILNAAYAVALAKWIGDLNEQQ